MGSGVDFIKRIIWAIDAFDGPNDIQANCSSVLRDLVETGRGVVEPVFVMNPESIWMVPQYVGAWESDFRPEAERAVARAVAQSQVPNCLPPRILVTRSSAVRESCDALADYALASGADAIVVGTHGWSGIRRWVLGSFAETLLTRSRVPVLTIGSHFRFHHLRGGSILVPSEFSHHSKWVFKRAVQMAMLFRSKVALLHSITHPVEALFQSGAFLLGGSWVPVQSYFSDELDLQSRRARIWAQWAKNRGVEVELGIEAESGPVWELIQERCQKGDIRQIVMETRASSVSATLIGSMARQVIRMAPCPTWVFRPESVGRIHMPLPSGVPRAA